MYGGSAAAENLSPQTMVRLGREIKELVQSAPDGVTYVANDEDSMAEVFADMEGPGTAVASPTFRQHLLLAGSKAPTSPPFLFYSGYTLRGRGIQAKACAWQ
jgi:hypothetical protein